MHLAELSTLDVYVHNVWLSNLFELTSVFMLVICRGFPPNNNHEKDQGEDIYGNLSDMAM